MEISTRRTKLKKNIWKLYLLKALSGFFISIPVIVVFWKSNGLSMFEITILQSVYAVAVIGLEIPSGYIADAYGRRKTLILSSIFATLGITVLGISSSFIQFLIGEVAWALGVSLISGADSAMFYDTLKELGKEENYQELWGKTNFYFMISAAISSVLGGLIATLSLRWTLLAQIPFFAAMMPLAYSLKEPKHYQSVKKEEKQTIKTMMYEAASTPNLRWILIYGGFIYAGLQVAFWFYQPYFQLVGIDLVSFGLIYAAFNIVSALSAKYAHRVEKRIGKAISLIMLTFLIATSLLLMSSFVLSISIIFIFLQQMVRGFSKPVISDYINKIVASEKRSTMLSAKSLIGRALQALALPLFGLLSDAYSLTVALFLMGMTVIIVGTTILAILKLEGIMEI